MSMKHVSKENSLHECVNLTYKQLKIILTNGCLTAVAINFYLKVNI